MPSGSKAALIRRMRASLAGSSSSRKYACFSVPMPCSPEMAPPSAMPGCEDRLQQLEPDLVVGLEDRQVHVAVAGVPAAGDQRPRGPAASSATSAMKAGIDARGTTMSTMSSAPSALATQNAFSRASISWVAAAGGRT